VISAPESHTLIVAKTRTGKGTRVIVPTLLRYSTGSALVIDPKGENAAITATMRRDLFQQPVHIINPWGELSSTFQKLKFPTATYNPLDILDPDDPNVVAIAQAMASAICPREAHTSPYWAEGPGSLLTAVLLWLTDTPGERKTLARVREIVTKGKKDLEPYLVKMAASEAFGGAVRENAGPFIGLAPETYSSVISSLAQYTKFLSDPQVKAATATSTFSMRDLMGMPSTVFIVIPPDRLDTQRTWLRLLITAGMQSFKKFHTGNMIRCMFLIDEFAALGRLDELPRDISTMAGYGVDFTLIVQGIDQLRDVYGDAHATILGNCAYKWFCNVNDLHSAEYLSKTLGKRTVQTTSTSGGMSGSTVSSSVSHAETGRDLLTPDEVLNLGRDTAILLAPNTRPHYLRPVDYWQLPQAFEHYHAAFESWYWNPPLFFYPNPYHSSGHGSGAPARR
jgi:type IV secretory pathway TraG/TraD family ATPase VirD4